MSDKSKAVLCVDVEDLLDTYFWSKYAAVVEFDGEYMVSYKDCSEILIPYYRVTEDPDEMVLALHEILIEEDT